MLVKKTLPNATILLHDLHNEYTQCFTDLPMYDSDAANKIETYVRSEVIWDQYALEQTLEDLRVSDAETRAEQAFKVAFDGALESLVNGDRPCTIWKIQGEYGGLDRAFTALKEALWPQLSDGGSTISPFWQPSGDDDVFDYWPSAMDMLWEFAQDLDTIAPDTYKRQVWEVIDEMIQVGAWADYLPGGESEFEWNASERWGYKG